MSLVIMNEQLSNELAHTVLEKLQDKLSNCIEKHLDGSDQSERISDICTETKCVTCEKIFTVFTMIPRP